MFEFSEEQIALLLSGIYKGIITPYDLPESLYYAIADYLKRGLYRGFGGDLVDFALSPELELLKELRENIYMFSAAKTYQEVRAMSDLLVKDGKVVEFRQFDGEARKLFDLYNKTWGETEHNTAIGQGQCAVKWYSIERDKDVLPLLKYSAVGGEATCEICGQLDGLIRPVEDPIWRTKSPLNHFNCMCVLIQLREGQITRNDKTRRLDKEVGDRMQPLFKMNPGIDKVVFSDDHPYFEVGRKDRRYARRNFDLPIPNKD